MNNSNEKILQKMNEHTLASFATISDDGKPWTRYVVVKGDDQMNIWFATFKNSRKVHQIAKNPDVHLVLGVSDPQTAVSWLQVQGRAEVHEDVETKNLVWYDLLGSIFSGPEDPNYVVCKVRPSRIEYYTMNVPQPEIWQA